MTHAFGVSRVLVGPSAQAEGSASGSLPAAASRRGKYRSKVAPAVFSPLLPSPRETAAPLTHLLGSSGFRLLFILKSAGSLAASSRLNPTPSHKIRHSLVSLLVTQHFVQLIGSILAPLLSPLATL